MTNDKNDIFSRKRSEVNPKNSTPNTYLESKKQTLTNKEFQEKIKHPESGISKGQNIRLPRETHALIKAISLTQNKEIYLVVQNAINDYIDCLDKKEQKELWNTLNSLINSKIIKL